MGPYLLRSGVGQPVGRNSSERYSRFYPGWTSYRRGVDLARSGHLLRFVRDSTGDETSHPCRHGPTPDRRMDATSCPESDGYRIRHAHSSLFTATLSESGLQLLKLPARSPNLNAFAERWVRSVKQECLSKLILFSEASLKRVLAEYLTHYHSERNHQGKENVLLFPAPAVACPQDSPVICKQRLGGLLKYYARAA